ncbi:endonuclease [Marivirga lumbricoides]|uniref:Endonuclease n=1 Tax=Marivirga lumbricoides TaxID=1046115 RepID=A0A2T4DF16_9BACT|nr:endonuclease [Marivirga lumbricoides]
MFTVYVLYSPTFKKIYIGYTSDLSNRLASHNVYSKKGYTTRYRPWEVLYTESYIDKRAALKREKALKSARGRAFIWQLISEKYA